MAQQQAPDDIFALYCRFDLDVSQYQVFDRGSVNLLDAETSASVHPVSEQTCVTSSTLAEDPGTGAVKHSVESLPSTTPEVQPEKTQEVDADRISVVANPEIFPESRPARTSEARAPRSQERPGFRNLLRNLQHFHDRSIAGSFGLPCHPVSVFGSGGGVGVTTVLATLARQLSKQGLSCGLYEEAEESILSYFFGFHRIAAHPSRFAGLSAVLEPAVRFLGPGHTPMNAAFPPGEFTQRERALQIHGSELDLFIADDGHSVKELFPGTSLFVTLPDLPSVAKIRSIVNRTGWGCGGEDTICVVNRFDPEVGLHRELLTWYEQQFAQVVTIRHSFLVPESLAEGTNIIEMAPDSEIAADFTVLAECLRRTIARTAPIPKKSDGPKTSLEGLALCS